MFNLLKSFNEKRRILALVKSVLEALDLPPCRVSVITIKLYLAMRGHNISDKAIRLALQTLLANKRD